MAAPLSQVLQTKVGAAAPTDYLYGIGRLASLNSGVKTWYAADALGSVRRTVTDAGVPLGIVNYDPWGTPESGTVPTFGFTGEIQEVGAGMVNLRARWYSTGRGRFTSVDPFAGMPETPYSLHQYQYGYSDPVSMTDPSGQNPEIDGFSKTPPWFTYSCNCGWIDWRHARPGPDKPAINIITQVKKAIAFFDNPANLCEDFYIIPAEEISHHTGKLGINIETTFEDVAIPRGKVNWSNWQQVAMGIFRWGDENLESIQEALAPGSTSAWSEEDLVSDLLAFYGALQGYTDDSGSYRYWVGRICYFPLDPKFRQELSLKIFNEYPGFTQNRTWENPILKSTPCIDEYCGKSRSPRAWPTEFRRVQPLPGGIVRSAWDGLSVLPGDEDKTWLVVFPYNGALKT